MLRLKCVEQNGLEVHWRLHLTFEYWGFVLVGFGSSTNSDSKEAYGRLT